MGSEYSIEMAKNWLRTAELSDKEGIPQTSLYSMEMSMEIAMKDVLESIGVDIPKTHYIERIFRKEIYAHKTSRGFIEKVPMMLDIFSELLRLRPLGGYGLGNLSKEEAVKMVKKMMPRVKDMVSLCEKEVR